ncbi:hypothetical protein ACFY5D_11425 [Paeniglutamicibacter sp. NPDC012692]|uniref:hypothetical protein n=1 Tax=Paeniglutamicibacter sp. NPDC012692 TaxID=3364388 RepID=UPI0036BF2D11
METETALDEAAGLRIESDCSADRWTRYEFSTRAGIPGSLCVGFFRLKNRLKKD